MELSTSRRVFKDRTRVVVILIGALALSACDGWFFRRFQITGPDTAAFSLNGSSTRAVISILRDYAAQSKLTCPTPDELPFECRRTPIRVWAESSSSGINVCYYAMGAQFEQGKFNRAMGRLQDMLVARFGADAVLPVLATCPPTFPVRMPPRAAVTAP